MKKGECHIAREKEESVTAEKTVGWAAPRAGVIMVGAKDRNSRPFFSIPP